MYVYWRFTSPVNVSELVSTRSASNVIISIVSNEFKINL